MDKEAYKTLGWLLLDAARLLRRRMEHEARDMPMTTAQLRILGRLLHNEGISQARLATMNDLEPMTLCRHVDRMETAGLVVRRPDPRDRRARRLYITPRGRALIEPMRDRAALVREQALQGLSEPERAALLAALEKVVANLSVQGADPESAPSAEPAEQETA